MFGYWNKKAKTEATVLKAATETLVLYEKIVNRSDTDVSLKEGDLITLKTMDFTFRSPLTNTITNSVGYVLEIKSVKKRKPLGFQDDLILAFCVKDCIKVVMHDSRLYTKAVDPKVPDILTNFINDTPITNEGYGVGDICRLRKGLLELDVYSFSDNSDISKPVIIHNVCSITELTGNNIVYVALFQTEYKEIFITKTYDYLLVKQ